MKIVQGCQQLRRATQIVGHLHNGPTSLLSPTSAKISRYTNPNALKFYIDGHWVDPLSPKQHEVLSPYTETPVGTIALGSRADVEKAVCAAASAFESYSRTTKEDRIRLLESILAVYQRRYNEIADVITLEMGCPTKLSSTAQAACGAIHLSTAIEELKKFNFSEQFKESFVVREPVGVVGLITPWNWPINQISCKVVPALACGCTMVLKPSEYSPFDAVIWAEILEEAGVPKGVFNLVQGTGEEVGEAIASHPHIHAVSFTGSTRAGIEVAKKAAETVKRVLQELGGKSPHIILEDADLEKTMIYSLKNVICSNSGQSCNAPTRLLVPQKQQDKAIELSKKIVSQIKTGDPWNPTTDVGPVVNKLQWERIQELIQAGINEGATLVIGGTGRPENLATGYFVKPTVFANVKNSMRIAREEIFGPVVVIIPYRDEEEAVGIANDTPYGLSSEISGRDKGKMLQVAARIRAGTVRFNNAPPSFKLPFGGYKQSGNGREWGHWAFHDFLEIKTILIGK